MTELEPLTNQTQFAQEEPLFESPVVPVKECAQIVQKKPFYKTKKMFAVVVFGLLFLFLLLVIAASGGKKDQVVVKEDEIPEEVLEILSPLQEKLILMQRQLDEADPTKHTLPFPPVDMDISIDEDS